MQQVDFTRTTALNLMTSWIRHDIHHEAVTNCPNCSNERAFVIRGERAVVNPDPCCEPEGCGVVFRFECLAAVFGVFGLLVILLNSVVFIRITVMETILEQQRRYHEERERLMDAMVKEMLHKKSSVSSS